ncbi:hypothetical protein [Candidatus Amarobacter glycogenicus]|uniref:hypothetical protein n=1 Tax=Candidatus Amarobacter glycogenicus TaxID=3140699 RepID=UPI003136D0D0|nr:hypothetical protein [Dehalococcoidia bacterium]
MVNPLLTILFDLFLIGSALAVTAAMATEYFTTREPHVGGMRRSRQGSPANSRRRATMHRLPAQRRRAA